MLTVLFKSCSSGLLRSSEDCPKILGLRSVLSGLRSRGPKVTDYRPDLVLSAPRPLRIEQMARDILKVLGLGRLQGLQSSTLASKAIEFLPK